MASWTAVMASSVVAEDRFDGEFFSPAYQQLDEELSRISRVDTLGRITHSLRKGIFDISPNRYRDNGIPLVRTQQIKSPLLSRDSMVYIEVDDQ